MLKSRILTIFGILCVFMLLFNMNSAAYNSGPPPVWAGRITLSTVDTNPSINPAIDGMNWVRGTANWQKLGVVYQEWSGSNWDIYAKIHSWSGVLLMDIWRDPGTNPLYPGGPAQPAVHPATTNANEVNPDVALTRDFSLSGGNIPEYHIVYQSDTNTPPTNSIWHTYAINFGIERTWAATQLSIINRDAQFPAIEYTEDLASPSGVFGFATHFVWMENNAGTWEIMYNAYVVIKSSPESRTYAFPSPIKLGNGMYPKIASVDETQNPSKYDFPFAVVWEAPAYGTTGIHYYTNVLEMVPGSGVWSLRNPMVTSSILSPNRSPFPWTFANPDIDATVDTNAYRNGLSETFFYHVVYEGFDGGGLDTIESQYYCGLTQTPAATAYIVTAYAMGPSGQPLDLPTVAVRLTSPATFYSIVAWEDSANPATATDIMYAEAFATTTAFAFYGGGWIVLPPAQTLGLELDPELWSDNDWAVDYTLQANFVFEDITPSVTNEVVFIDP